MNLPTPLVVVIALAAVAVVALVLVTTLLRRKPESSASPSADLSIDLSALSVSGPDNPGPRLTYYGTPVQLVVLVLAPAGRGTAFPEKHELRHIVDRLIPNLSVILDHHRPIYRQWPEQLSTQGFSQSFFTNVQLPGDRGKGTPWCGIAGRFDMGEGHLLAGLVCKAAAPNGLSEIVVQHEGQWNDILRVRSD